MIFDHLLCLFEAEGSTCHVYDFCLVGQSVDQGIDQHLVRDYLIPTVEGLVEKARAFDPFGHAGLTPLGEIRMTLAGEIKMTPVEASAGEFFCSFETPCPGTAGINLKNYRI